jgi:hypothetical protein
MTVEEGHGSDRLAKIATVSAAVRTHYDGVANIETQKN